MSHMIYRHIVNVLLSVAPSEQREQLLTKTCAMSGMKFTSYKWALIQALVIQYRLWLIHDSKTCQSRMLILTSIGERQPSADFYQLYWSRFIC